MLADMLHHSYRIWAILKHQERAMERHKRRPNYSHSRSRSHNHLRLGRRGEVDSCELSELVVVEIGIRQGRAGQGRLSWPHRNVMETGFEYGAKRGGPKAQDRLIMRGWDRDPRDETQEREEMGRLSR